MYGKEKEKNIIKKTASTKKKVLLGTLIPISTLAVAGAVAVPVVMFVLNKSTVTIEGADFDQSTSKIEVNKESTIILKAKAGTKIKSIKKVVVDGKELKENQDYTFDPATNKIVIKAEAMTSTKIEIVVESEPVTPTIEIKEIIVDPIAEQAKGYHLKKDNLIVKGKFTDESTKSLTIKTDYVVFIDTTDITDTIMSDSGYVFETEGDFTLTIKSVAKSTVSTNLTIKITSTPTVKKLTGITLSGTYKTEYTTGDTLNLDGLIVTAHYTVGDDQQVTDYTTTPSKTKKLTKEDTQVTISYTEGDVTKTESYNITVTDPVVEKKLSSITLSGTYKTTYKVGDKLELDGLIVTAHYTVGDDQQVTNYTTDPTTEKELTEEDTKVTVSYTEDDITKTAEFDIKVNPKGIDIEVEDQPMYVEVSLQEEPITAESTKFGLTIKNNSGEEKIIAVRANNGADNSQISEVCFQALPANSETKTTFSVKFNQSLEGIDDIKVWITGTVEFDCEEDDILTESLKPIISETECYGSLSSFTFDLEIQASEAVENVKFQLFDYENWEAIGDPVTKDLIAGTNTVTFTNIDLTQLDPFRVYNITVEALPSEVEVTYDEEAEGHFEVTESKSVKGEDVTLRIHLIDESESFGPNDDDLYFTVGETQYDYNYGEGKIKYDIEVSEETYMPIAYTFTLDKSIWEENPGVKASEIKFHFAAYNLG